MLSDLIVPHDISLRQLFSGYFAPEEQNVYSWLAEPFDFLLRGSDMSLSGINIALLTERQSWAERDYKHDAPPEQRTTVLLVRSNGLDLFGRHFYPLAP